MCLLESLKEQEKRILGIEDAFASLCMAKSSEYEFGALVLEENYLNTFKMHSSSLYTNVIVNRMKNVMNYSCKIRRVLKEIKTESKGKTKKRKI